MTDILSFSEGDSFRHLCLRTAEEVIPMMPLNETYNVVTETAVSLSKNYILHLDVSGKDDLHVAVGLTNDPCIIYKLANEGFTKLCSFTGHEESISELKFDKTDSNLIYTSSIDGTLKVWDLRDSKEAVNTYKGQESLKTPLLSFDVDCCSRILCAGTEHTDGDAFLLFWDCRSSKLLGGYWESHDDDITQVSFHETKRDLMATGSTDGLINVFDVSQSSEDDSLLYTYNTSNSVQKLSWFRTNTVDKALSCITHTNDLQLWDMENCTKLGNYERTDITKYTKRIPSEDCYLINTHLTKRKELIVLAGSNAGEGERLEALSFHEGDLKSKISFPSNKQIIRSSWFDKQNEMFIMGGESGILSVWKPCSEVKDEVKNDHKILSKKNHKVKPY